MSFSSEQSVEPDEKLNIYMDKVVSLKADGNGEGSIMMSTTDEKIALKAGTKEETSKWIFAFQKSVALVLSKTIDAALSHSFQPISDPKLFGRTTSSEFRRLDSKNW